MKRCCWSTKEGAVLKTYPQASDNSTYTDDPLTSSSFHLWHRHQTTSLTSPTTETLPGPASFPHKGPIHHFFTRWLKWDEVAGDTRAKYGTENPSCTRVVAMWYPNLLLQTSQTGHPSCPAQMIMTPRDWKPPAGHPALVCQFLTCFPHISQRPPWLIPINTTSLPGQHRRRGGRAWDIRSAFVATLSGQDRPST